MTDASPSSAPVAGLVLAGGQSRRFGTDKAAHVLGGRPMVARVAAAVAAVAAPVWLSVRSASAPGYGLGLPRLPDRYAGAGPLAGLHAGLARAEAEGVPWLLAAACDLPGLTPEALRRLLAARTPELDAVVAMAEGRLQPLCACYRAELAGRADAYLRAERRAMHAFLDGLRVGRVALPTEVLRNVNRAEDGAPEPPSA